MDTTASFSVAGESSRFHGNTPMGASANNANVLGLGLGGRIDEEGEASGATSSAGVGIATSHNQEEGDDEDQSVGNFAVDAAFSSLMGNGNGNGGSSHDNNRPHSRGATHSPNSRQQQQRGGTGHGSRPGSTSPISRSKAAALSKNMVKVKEVPLSPDSLRSRPAWDSNFMSAGALTAGGDAALAAGPGPVTSASKAAVRAAAALLGVPDALLNPLGRNAGPAAAAAISSLGLSREQLASLGLDAGAMASLGVSAGDDGEGGGFGDSRPGSPSAPLVSVDLIRKRDATRKLLGARPSNDIRMDRVPAMQVVGEILQSASKAGGVDSMPGLAAIINGGGGSKSPSRANSPANGTRSLSPLAAAGVNSRTDPTVVREITAEAAAVIMKALEAQRTLQAAQQTLLRASAQTSPTGNANGGFTGRSTSSPPSSRGFGGGGGGLGGGYQHPGFTQSFTSPPLGYGHHQQGGLNVQSSTIIAQSSGLLPQQQKQQLLRLTSAHPQPQSARGMEQQQRGRKDAAISPMAGDRSGSASGRRADSSDPKGNNGGGAGGKEPPKGKVAFGRRALPRPASALPSLAPRKIAASRAAREAAMGAQHNGGGMGMGMGMGGGNLNGFGTQSLMGFNQSLIGFGGSIGDLDGGGSAIGPSVGLGGTLGPQMSAPDMMSGGGAGGGGGGGMQWQSASAVLPPLGSNRTRSTGAPAGPSMIGNTGSLDPSLMLTPAQRAAAKKLLFSGFPTPLGIRGNDGQVRGRLKAAAVGPRPEELMQTAQAQAIALTRQQELIEAQAALLSQYEQQLHQSSVVLASTSSSMGGAATSAAAAVTTEQQGPASPVAPAQQQAVVGAPAAAVSIASTTTPAGQATKKDVTPSPSPSNFLAFTDSPGSSVTKRVGAAAAAADASKGGAAGNNNSRQHPLGSPTDSEVGSAANSPNRGPLLSNAGSDSTGPSASVISVGPSQSLLDAVARGLSVAQALLASIPAPNELAGDETALEAADGMLGGLLSLGRRLVEAALAPALGATFYLTPQSETQLPPVIALSPGCGPGTVVALVAKQLADTIIGLGFSLAHTFNKRRELGLSTARSSVSGNILPTDVDRPVIEAVLGGLSRLHGAAAAVVDMPPLTARRGSGSSRQLAGAASGAAASQSQQQASKRRPSAGRPPSARAGAGSSSSRPGSARNSLEPKAEPPAVAGARPRSGKSSAAATPSAAVIGPPAPARKAGGSNNGTRPPSAGPTSSTHSAAAVAAAGNDGRSGNSGGSGSPVPKKTAPPPPRSGAETPAAQEQHQSNADHAAALHAALERVNRADTEAMENGTLIVASRPASAPFKPSTANDALDAAALDLLGPVLGGVGGSDSSPSLASPVPAVDVAPKGAVSPSGSVTSDGDKKQRPSAANKASSASSSSSSPTSPRSPRQDGPSSPLFPADAAAASSSASASTAGAAGTGPAGRRTGGGKKGAADKAAEDAEAGIVQDNDEDGDEDDEEQQQAARAVKKAQAAADKEDPDAAAQRAVETTDNAVAEAPEDGNAQSAASTIAAPETVVFTAPASSSSSLPRPLSGKQPRLSAGGASGSAAATTTTGGGSGSARRPSISRPASGKPPAFPPSASASGSSSANAGTVSGEAQPVADGDGEETTTAAAAAAPVPTPAPAPEAAPAKAAEEAAAGDAEDDDEYEDDDDYYDDDEEEDDEDEEEDLPEPDFEPDQATVNQEATTLHLERLREFAREVAPAMLGSLDAAWAKYGHEPSRVWATIEKRYPGATQEYASDIPVVAKARAKERIKDERAQARALARAQSAQSKASRKNSAGTKKSGSKPGSRSNSGGKRLASAGSAGGKRKRLASAEERKTGAAARPVSAAPEGTGAAAMPSAGSASADGSLSGRPASAKPAIGGGAAVAAIANDARKNLASAAMAEKASSDAAGAPIIPVLKRNPIPLPAGALTSVLAVAQAHAQHSHANQQQKDANGSSNGSNTGLVLVDPSLGVDVATVERHALFLALSPAPSKAAETVHQSLYGTSSSGLSSARATSAGKYRPRSANATNAGAGEHMMRSTARPDSARNRPVSAAKATATATGETVEEIDEGLQELQDLGLPTTPFTALLPAHVTPAAALAVTVAQPAYVFVTATAALTPAHAVHPSGRPDSGKNSAVATNNASVIASTKAAMLTLPQPDEAVAVLDLSLYEEPSAARYVDEKTGSIIPAGGSSSSAAVPPLSPTNGGEGEVNVSAVATALTPDAEANKAALVVRITPGLPPIPTLREASAMLAALSPLQTALLGYVKHIRPPHPAVVVAFGVLCVLLDCPTTWRSAVATACAPDLVPKLLHLSATMATNTDSRPGSAMHPAMARPQSGKKGIARPQSAYALLAGADVVDGKGPLPTSSRTNIDAAAAAAAAAVAESEAEHQYIARDLGIRSGADSGAEEDDGTTQQLIASASPVPGLPAPYPYPTYQGAPLAVKPRMLSLARKLLNKRPDIRAEVRCMRLSVARDPAAAAFAEDGTMIAPPSSAQTSGHSNLAFESVPFAALIALVEWEVSFLLHHTIRQRLQARLARLTSTGAAHASSSAPDLAVAANGDHTPLSHPSASVPALHLGTTSSGSLAPAAGSARPPSARAGATAGGSGSARSGGGSSSSSSRPPSARGVQSLALAASAYGVSLEAAAGGGGSGSRPGSAKAGFRQRPLSASSGSSQGGSGAVAGSAGAAAGFQ